MGTGSLKPGFSVPRHLQAPRHVRSQHSEDDAAAKLQDQTLRVTRAIQRHIEGGRTIVTNETWRFFGANEQKGPLGVGWVISYKDEKLPRLYGDCNVSQYKGPYIKQSVTNESWRCFGFPMGRGVRYSP